MTESAKFTHPGRFPNTSCSDCGPPPWVYTHFVSCRWPGAEHSNSTLLKGQWPETRVTLFPGWRSISTYNICFSCQMPLSLFLRQVRLFAQKTKPWKSVTGYTFSWRKKNHTYWVPNERGNQKMGAADRLLLGCTFKDLFIDGKQDMAQRRRSVNTP